jgi:cell division septation protein DedD
VPVTRGALRSRAVNPLRALFLALVLVNFLVHAWQVYAPQTGGNTAVPGAVSTAKLGGRRLVLLSELPSMPENRPAEFAQIDQGVEEGAESIPSEQTAPTATLPASTPAVPRVPGSAEPSPMQQHRCYALGPFVGAPDAAAAAQTLAAHAATAPAVRQVEAQEQIGFWVLLPPLESREAAVDKARELRGRGIDSFVVTRGGPPNSISLGVFGQRAAADKHAQQLRAKGIAPVVEPRLRAREQYWLDFDGTDAEHVSQDALTELLAKRAGIAWSETPCE